MVWSRLIWTTRNTLQRRRCTVKRFALLNPLNREIITIRRPPRTLQRLTLVLLLWDMTRILATVPKLFGTLTHRQMTSLVLLIPRSRRRKKRRNVKQESHVAPHMIVVRYWIPRILPQTFLKQIERNRPWVINTLTPKIRATRLI